MSNWKREKLIEVLAASNFEEDACWIWPRGSVAAGYGVIWEPNFGGKGKPHYVHKIALELWGKVIRQANQTHTRHTCNNKGCFNPAHLLWGTHQDNMLDKRKDLLKRYNITPYTLVLIKQTVQLSERSIARAYAIPRSLVHRIRQGYYDDV